MDEARAVRRRERRVAVAAARLAMLALAARQDGLRPAVRAEAHDLEPTVGIGQVEESAAGHRPRPGRPFLAATGDAALLAARDVDEVDLGRREVRRPEGLRGDRLAVGRPDEVLDVEAGRGHRPRLRRLGIAGRPAPTWNRSVDEEDLRPAAASRDKGKPPSLGRPARQGDAGRVRGDEDVAAAVHVDDPDLIAAGVGDPPPVRRPLRVGQVLLRGGDRRLGATPERGDEDLASSGGLLREEDRAVPRMDPDLARRVDGDEPLDRQAAGRGAQRRPRSPASGTIRSRHRSSSLVASDSTAGAGHVTRAIHGPTIAWCART